MKTLVSICSARPNFVKLAAIHHAFVTLKPKDARHIIVHTGQHYDPLFSDIFFEQLQIPLPALNLGIQAKDREDVIEKTAQALTDRLPGLRPDTMLIYGDVNGAVGAARAAKQSGIRIAHIEAGLRSFDKAMPEELNRIEIDQLTDILFVTEQSGMDNLQKEKCPGQAFLVGNTMIDTLVRMMSLIEKEPLPQGIPEKFAVATLHRPSNVDTKESLAEALAFLSEISSILPVILPLHHRTKAAIERFELQDAVAGSLRVVDPLGYVPFLALMRRSAFVLTDSGGIQEEATFLSKRCFTLRKNTERPATIKSGSNVLIDLEHAKDRKAVIDYATDPVSPKITVPLLWDGKAGERILRHLL